MQTNTDSNIVVPKQYDYILYTDGSGYELDGFSGWCAQAYSQVPGTDKRRRIMGCMSGSTVDRAELTALLEGLEMILAMDKGVPCIGERRPDILWYSDRESLVGGVMKIWGPDKGRNSSPDLWARFAHYERKVHIRGVHVARETDFPEFIQRN